MSSNPVTTIIAPVDGSGPAISAARHAGYLARLLGARLQLLYVMPAGPAELMDVPANRRREADADLAEKRHHADEALEAARKALDISVQQQASELVIEDVAHHGDPATVIVDQAKQIPESMVVMGARGLGGLKKFFLGSVSEETLHRAPCPVTVVHENDHPANQPGLSLILLPVDGSEYSDAAARLVGELARRSGAAVHLLFAYPRHPAEIGGVGGAMGDFGALSESMVDSFIEAGRQEARRVFDQGRERLGEIPGGVMEYQLASGDPAAAIVAHAEQQDVPAGIVMGRRGMGPWQERLLGSVSSTVVARSPCPVTVIH
ncbi:MAG: universal stress protein [Ectothiorhodospiraceae bacterium]|nr:universal stress protein [Ectothiorhodospiraceae bacterium]